MRRDINNTWKQFCRVADIRRHQKKALTFMMKREEGWKYDGSQEDLWAKELDETGQMR